MFQFLVHHRHALTLGVRGRTASLAVASNSVFCMHIVLPTLNTQVHGELQIGQRSRPQMRSSTRFDNRSFHNWKRIWRSRTRAWARQARLRGPLLFFRAPMLLLQVLQRLLRRFPFPFPARSPSPLSQRSVGGLKRMRLQSGVPLEVLQMMP